MFSVCEIYCGSVDNSMNLQQRKVSVFGKLVNVLLMEECGSFKNCSCLEGKGGGNREHERVPVWLIPQMTTVPGPGAGSSCSQVPRTQSMPSTRRTQSLQPLPIDFRVCISRKLGLGANLGFGFSDLRCGRSNPCLNYQTRCVALQVFEYLDNRWQMWGCWVTKWSWWPECSSMQMWASWSSWKMGLKKSIYFNARKF